MNTGVLNFSYKSILKELALLAAVICFPIWFLIKVVAVVLGLIVCPIAMFSWVCGDQPTEPFTKPGATLGRWSDRQFRQWAWLWSNARDGLVGDKRGSYFLGCGKKINWWTMLNWSMLRNPANNLRQIPWLSCYVPDCSFWWFGSNVNADNRKGGEGWFFCWARNQTSGFCYFGFVFWMPYGNGRGLHIKLGHKIKPEHKDAAPTELSKDRKGMAFYINPWREDKG